MNCCDDPCLKQDIFSDCFSEEAPLIIGKIAEINFPVIVFVQNIATRRVDQYISTSDSSGLVLLFEEDQLIYLPQHTPIRIWLKDSTDLMLPNIAIIDDGVEYGCIEISISA